MIEKVLNLFERLVIAIELLAQGTPRTATEVTNLAVSTLEPEDATDSKTVNLETQNAASETLPADVLRKGFHDAMIVRVGEGNYNNKAKSPKLEQAITLIDQGKACPSCNGTGLFPTGGKCTPCKGKGEAVSTVAPTQESEPSTTAAATATCEQVRVEMGKLIEIGNAKQGDDAGRNMCKQLIKNIGKVELLDQVDPMYYPALIKGALNLIDDLNTTPEPTAAAAGTMGI